MSHLKKSILRIVHDLVEFTEDPIDGIEVIMNKEDIFNQTAMIVGPKDTPYFGGFYFFDICFPKDYPMKPPTVTMKTIDGNIRFNPNLYENGKVCLSILGTWSGPGWKSIMTLKTVLLSIQSLMNDFPIINEPGYENTKRDAKINIDYNCYITYHNYRIAIIDVIKKKRRYKVYYNLYEKEINKYIERNINELYNNLMSYKIIYASGSIEKIVYFLKHDNPFDFITLEKDFIKVFKKNLKNLKSEKNDNI